MRLEQTARLPFYDTFPVQVQIRIASDTSGYTAFISANLSNWSRFRISLKPHDVEELNSELQQAIEELSGDLESAEVLSKLAYKGNYAFKRVFAEGVPRDIIDLALRRKTTIQISSEEFFIPWELLYDGPLGAQVTPAYFWGMQHIISRALIQEARPGDLESPTIVSSLPRVGLIVDNRLEHVVGMELPMLQDLHEQKRISLVTLRPLNADQRDVELEHVGCFLRDELQVVHLACHAVEKKPTSQSCLYISNVFPITVEDFRIQEFEIKHKPLVILNACLTGTMSPLYTSNWAALFWERGARGVLATECHVPDQFAAVFAEQLYSHLLLSKPIGEALLDTRHHFWKEQSNPLGLAYALYSSPSIKIASPRTEREAIANKSTGVPDSFVL